MVDQHGRCCLRVARGQTPWLLHSLGVHAHHRPNLAPLCRNPCVAQLARPAAFANPLGSRLALAFSVSHPDVAAETDDIAEAERLQEREQLLIAEAAVG